MLVALPTHIFVCAGVAPNKCNRPLPTNPYLIVSTLPEHTFAELATASLSGKKGDHATLYPANPWVGYRLAAAMGPGLCMAIVSTWIAKTRSAAHLSTPLLE